MGNSIVFDPAKGNPPFLGEMFGNFLLLSKIANGGMAAIFLARPATATANGRILVVKRILPQVANDPEFLEMFKSEIRVCMGFSHPNIVQIYDFGQVAGQPYIAMEFVEGKNLRELLNQFQRKGIPLPIGVAVSVAAQTAAGLHYAHTFRNRVTGDLQKVIHRDVSPQNILLSYDGNVKVIDFGIAKALVDDIEQTRTGSIKGKVSYLSPEQVKREPLDVGSDIFSLGVVLWEMLTGHKLFTMNGTDDFEVMDMIRNCGDFVRPPSQHNPAVPQELDRIIMKALHPSRQERYATAEDFQKELRNFIVYSIPGFGYSDVAQCIRSHFQDELKAERASVKRLNEQAQALLESRAPDEVTEISLPASMPEVPRYKGGTHTNIEILKPEAQARSERAMSLPQFHGPSSLEIYGYPQAGAVALREPQFKVTRLRVLLAVLYVATIWFIKVDEQYFFFERFTMPSKLVERYASTDSPFRPRVAQASMSRKLASAPSLAAPGQREVMLKINIVPETPGIPTDIYVNNAKVSSSDRVVRIPVDRKIQVRVQRRNWKPYLSEFTLSSAKVGDSTKFKLDVNLSSR